MKTFEISGSSRTEIGKKSTKALRAENKVPCVLYGEKENLHFALSNSDLRKLIYTPHVFLVDLKIDDKPYQAIIKDLQFHPVSDELLHIDFLPISDKKPITIEIPVKLNGLAPGVREGGKLALRMRKIRVKALAASLPDILDIDISNLNLGQSINISDLSFDGLEMMNAKNAVVCSVNLTRAARGLAAAEAGQEGAEGAEE